MTQRQLEDKISQAWEIEVAAIQIHNDMYNTDVKADADHYNKFRKIYLKSIRDKKEVK